MAQSAQSPGNKRGLVSHKPAGRLGLPTGTLGRALLMVTDGAESAMGGL